MVSSTKSSQFSAKVNQLAEFSARLNDANSNSEVISHDIVTSLRYFENQLLSWIKDCNPCFNISEYDFNRTNFPSVDYQQLFQTLLGLLPNLHDQGDKELNDAAIRTLGCLLPFVDKETFVNMPCLLSETLYDVESFFHSRIIDLMVQYVIPLIYSFMTKNTLDPMEEINLIVPSILGNVLDASSDAASWTKVMECLMRFKLTASTDLVMILAYGTKESLKASIHLLNRYFPPVDIASMKTYQSSPYDNIRPFICQHRNCTGTKDATMLSLDPTFCAAHRDAPPPMYLCEKCYEGVDKRESQLFIYVVQPADLISQICDNIDCRFGFMKALYFCFSPSCIKKNSGKPIRLCEDCHKRLHLGIEERHINHECIKELWITDNPEQTYLVDAIVRLGNEAQPNFQEKCNRMGLSLEVEIVDKSQQDSVQYIAKVFSSLHGLLLLQKICPIPPSQYHLEHLGRLVAMLLVWVESVDYASHPEAVKILKPQRQQAIAWLNKVADYDFNFFCSCLLPDPPMYVRLGHPWNMLTSVVRKDLEILQRIVTLTKYELVPKKVWDFIMPEWFQEIKTRVPIFDVKKFKVVLSALFGKHSEIRPDYALDFIKKHLESSIFKQSQEALVWVQILSYLDVQLDIRSLIEMFIELLINKEESVSNIDHNIQSVFAFPDKDTLHKVTSSGTLSRQNSLHSAPLKSPHGATLPTLKTVQDDLSISILMLDVLIKQLTLQNSGTVFIADKESVSLNVLLAGILDQSFEGEHIEMPGFSCPRCQIMNTVFYLVALLVDLAIKRTVTVDQAKVDYTHAINSRRSSSNASRRSRESVRSGRTIRSSTGNSSYKADYSPLGERPIIEEQEEEELEELEEEEEEKDENGKNDDENILEEARFSKEQVCRVDSGRFRSDISESSLNSIPELQILERLLQELSDCHETSVVVHILTSLDILCIRGECLQMVADEDADLLRKLQQNLLIPNLWRRLESSSSNIGRTIIPLLLHCASLPYGADQLCGCIEADFTNDDWKTRFAAVEKTGLLCQFIEADYIKTSSLAQSAVVHSICYLTIALEDVNVTVGIRARGILQSIKISSLKHVYKYMREHFIKIVEDRLVLLNTYRTLHMVIPQSSPMSGQFFLDILQNTKYVEDKMETRIKHLVRDSTIIDEEDSHMPEDCLPMFSRNLTNLRRFGKAVLVPINVYRHNLTIQTGTLWKEVINDELESDPSLRKFARLVSDDGCPKIDPSLDTVTEEEEDSSTRSKFQSLQELTVTNEIGSAEDEIMSLLIALLFEFLSKETKTKVDPELGTTDQDEINAIVRYFGQAMGFEPSFPWKVNKSMNMRRFRKNPIFVAFLMNLPRLLDGNTERGKLFLPLVLVVMETCIKGKPGEQISQNHTSLLLLESHLLRSWLMSLIVILYKYPIQEYRDSVWLLMAVVKNTLDGHGHHVCSNRSNNQVISIRNVVHLKMNLKTVFKKHNIHNVGSGGVGANGEVEMTDFSGNSSSLMEDLNDTRNSRPGSELFFGLPDTTEELLLETNQFLCQRCKMMLFNHEEEIINNCLIALLTFIHMDTEKAAGFIVDVVKSVVWKAKVISVEDTSKTPQLGLSTTSSIAQQVLRCIFNKLAHSRLFPELFSVEEFDDDFFVIITSILADFQFLNVIEPIRLIMQDLMVVENHTSESIHMILLNLSRYMECMIEFKNLSKEWSSLKNTFQSFFGSSDSIIPKGKNMDCLLNILNLLLRHQQKSIKFLIEEVENTMTFIIKNCIFSNKSLYKLTTSTYTKEKDQCKLSKDQMKLTRKVAFILSNVLAGRSSLSEDALVKLVQFFCHDVGTKFRFGDYEDTMEINLSKPRAVECLDVNSSSEIIEYLKAPCRRIKDLNEIERSDTSSYLKLSIFQIVSVYLSKIDSRIFKESRFYYKVLAVLLAEQSQERLHTTATNDIQEHITHFRMYSWLLLGAINHSVVMATPIIQLIPMVKAPYISDYLNVVFESLRREMTEETSKKTKTRPQLYFSFLLIQIWNIYIEMHYNDQQYMMPEQDQQHGVYKPIAVIREFWSKITPVLYDVLKQSQKSHSEAVSLFAHLVENISTHCPKTFSQLYPLWQPLLDIYSNEIPSSVKKRIKNFNMVEEDEIPSLDKLSLWVTDMHKRLWSAERLMKGKPTQTVNV